MRLTARHASRAVTLVALVATVPGCHHEKPADVRGPAPQLVDPVDDRYVAAPADSCQRAQFRAERASVFRVMREAMPYRTNEKPAYPLRERPGRYQQVTVQFLVAPTGRVDLANVKFISSSGPRFEESVREVLPRWRFTPAELVPGCRVWFRVTMPVVFYTPPMAGTR